ncbi:protein phosphatase [Haladaptatus sp. W1]|uniref:HEAT repeat domain-containing protein n=1 Tax=Haladaptatus sp. W1 TaxID=1897478 RepID=UPI0008499589|nr:HEAT repeat domain-containing protein [Haladaptatus sp. W1]ODR82933.1 protein phosphatase [Haladaptatus sp. W1]
MRDPEEATDGPTDPQVHPEQSPGFGEHPEGLSDIEVSRDVTIGEASKRELAASDVTPLVAESVATKLETLTSGDAVERRRAALALGEVSCSDLVVETLLRAGRLDDEADVRQFAVESLAKLGGERAEEGAIAISYDDDPWVRAEAFVALDRLDSDAHADRIEEGLADDHHAVRRNAAISLFKLRGEDSLEHLLELAADPSERVREWVAHMLGGIDDDRATATLEAFVNDADEPEIVRNTAARALTVDPGTFRRQFGGPLDEMTTELPGEDVLNRRPNL